MSRDFDTRMTALSFEPLTPTAYLDRAAAAHGERTAVVDGRQRWTYAELRERCRHLAGALAPLVDGRPVAVLAPNTHVLLEAHFGVPWSGVPLVAVNTRLSAREIAYILAHSEASVLVVGPAFDDLADDALSQMDTPPTVISAGDQYEKLLARSTPVSRPPPCTCGRCRCFTATAGAFRGPSPRPRPHMCVCPRSIPPRY